MQLFWGAVALRNQFIFAPAGVYIKQSCQSAGSAYVAQCIRRSMNQRYVVYMPDASHPPPPTPQDFFGVVQRNLSEGRCSLVSKNCRAFGEVANWENNVHCRFSAGSVVWLWPGLCQLCVRPLVLALLSVLYRGLCGRGFARCSSGHL